MSTTRYRPVAQMAAQMQAAQQQEQPSNTMAYLLIAALLVAAFWSKISPYIPDEINPVPVPDATSPFGDVEGLHVLIAYSAEADLTREQDNIINSTRLREAVPRGNFRALDTQSTFILPEEKLWADVMDKLKAANRPFSIAVGNKGKGGYIGDLPETEDKTIELVNKYK